MGVCCVCGRELTHPVSVELGIDPECGQHWWNWDLVGGYSKENIARLKQVIHTSIKVDSWIPRSVIKEEILTQDIVTTPTNHSMLKPRIVNTEKSATLVTYQNSGNPAIKIKFPFDPATVNQVKTLPGRKFHNEQEKYWTTPLQIETLEKLQEWGFTLDPKLISHLKQSKVNVNQVEEVVVSGLENTLFPFQKKGVAFIEHRNGRALIADEMGLGKTIQALAWLRLHPEKRPVVVVVPASLKLNWYRECHMWLQSPKVQILQGTKIVPIIGEIIIVNYDILTDWIDVLKTIKTQVLILDECHYIKNNSAKRTKAVKMLGKTIPHVIALSGTPIVNRPVEAYNALKLIDNTIVPDFWNYAHRYCGAKHNGYGWDFSGATNTEELHEKLTNTVMIRRRKEDVLTDLPDKIRSFLPIELSNEKEYDEAERNFIAYVRKTKGSIAAIKVSNAEVLAEIEGLKQLAIAGKMKQAISWIRDFVEVNGKLVVFAVHRFVIDKLMEEFGDIAVKVDGSVTGESRQQAVDRFQNDDKIRLFVGNIKAAGVGITLTAASNVAFLELPWTPGDVSQAEDRCHRIGQKDSVTIHYLLAVNTIEEKIAQMLDSKRQVLDSILDGKETDNQSLLTELMNEYL